ncbi:MAG: class 1 fructose-bisphosphatase [Candidatus Rokuibacteriota bacterium]|nr:MAG: class 1 fructose-bisphosphatase [Candidatus Rokubacteria bacterium]
MNEIALRLAQQVRAEGAHGNDPLGAVLAQLAVAGKLIARELAHAALAGQLGTTGDVNVQGEVVKKLDVWGNDVMVNALEASGHVCLMISEEMSHPLHLPERCGDAEFVVCFDPVDGSSNLDINGVVGTIFSIRRRTSRGPDHVAADAVLPGTAQVAAGYIMYGPSTAFVYTAGGAVHGFTLEPTIGEFVRSHEGVRIPSRGHTYSVNDSRAPTWPEGVRRYVEYLRAHDPKSSRPYTARYVGSMVADVHRTLLQGGVFFYPGEVGSDGRATGKLRLQYEAAPMALVLEHAGGKASTGKDRILDIIPDGPHQRVPLVIGSPEDVTLFEDFLRRFP